jgi:hypothetical protein
MSSLQLNDRGIFLIVHNASENERHRPLVLRKCGVMFNTGIKYEKISESLKTVSRFVK